MLPSLSLPPRVASTQRWSKMGSTYGPLGLNLFTERMYKRVRLYTSTEPVVRTRGVCSMSGFALSFPDKTSQQTLFPPGGAVPRCDRSSPNHTARAGARNSRGCGSRSRSSGISTSSSAPGGPTNAFPTVLRVGPTTSASQGK